MLLVFCLSNLHVPYTLSVASHSKETVCVYSDQKTIVDLLQRFGFQNVMVFDACRFHKKSSNKIQTLWKIFYTLLYRRYCVLRQLRKMQPSTVYFFHDSFGTMELWLVAKLAKVTSVLYCPTLRHAKQSEVQWSKRDYAIVNWYEKMCWGIERFPIQYGDVRWFVTDNFFEKNKILETQIPCTFSQDGYQKMKRSFSSNKKVLLLVENMFSNPAIATNVYFAVIQQIIDKVGTDHIILKNHPRFPFDMHQYLQGNFEEMPSEIPVNLMLQDFNIVIGNWSSVLFEAEYSSVCAVSLLPVFCQDYRSDLYEGHLRYLQDNDVNKKILYPQTIDELCNIVKKYV